jgi:hypothetical protein
MFFIKTNELNPVNVEVFEMSEDLFVVALVKMELTCLLIKQA